METQSLDDVLKQISKKYGLNVVRTGVEDLTVDGTLSLGSPSFDFAVYGGIPEGRIVEFSGQEGSGKAQPLWSKILTPEGYIEMRDVKEGTTVIDGKGCTTTVTGVYPRGKLPIYKVVFNDRTETYCAADHLWKVYNHCNGQKPKVEILTTTDLCQRDLHRGCWGYSVDVPTVDVWADDGIDIDPYLLGALIGDGALCNNRGFSNAEQDVVAKVDAKLQACGSVLKHYENNAAWDYSIVGEGIFPKLKQYNLLVKSTEKHIPVNYLHASLNTRVELVRGLYDTDGYTDSAGNMSFSTSSELLAADVAFLLRSLGCRVTVSCCPVTHYTNTEGRHDCGPSWTLGIKTPAWLTIATSQKHLNRIKRPETLPASSRWWRSIVSIDYVGEEECQCIMVDSEEHTYLTDDLICTHNTTTAFLAAASYQKVEIERNPDKPRSIVLLDNEGTADPIWALKLGYNMGEDAAVKTICIRPEAQSAEEIFDMALDMLKTGEVGLLIFDSIATLVPQQIADESMEKQQMGGIAKALTRFANTAIGLLRKYKATLIAINQVRDNMTGYGDPLITPGGRSWKHACSMRLMFKRGEFFDEDGNVLTKSAESPAGHIIEVYVLKTKVCKWDRKLGYMALNYTKGVDILRDTLTVATHFGFIDNSVQGTFKLVNPATGELMCDAEGNEIKIRGKKNLTTYFRSHPEDWRTIYDMCYERLRRREDPNIKSFEEMLSIDVKKQLGVTDHTQLEEI